MTTEAKNQISSTELGSLWMLYQTKSATFSLFDLVKERTIDKEAQNILSNYTTESQNIENKIVDIFNSEKVVIPLGFEEADIVREAPALFDDFFNIMFLRQMVKLHLGTSAVSFSYVIYERS